MPRLLVALSTLFVLSLLGAPAASATSSTVRVAIGDQNPDMFTNPAWKPLGMERTRYFIRWDAADHPDVLAQADRFVAAAKANDVDVLLHISTDDFDIGEGTLPTPDRYRQKVGRLVARFYAEGVREWGVWNEANDRTQPTYKSPRRAAQFYQELYRLLDDSDRCGPGVTRKCRIVALDLLDGNTKQQQGNTRSYAQRFFDNLSPLWRGRARIVGIHNYSDTNRNGTSGTKNIISTVRKRNSRARFWLTETGGVVRLGGTQKFKCAYNNVGSRVSAERRAVKAVSWMFRLATSYRRDVDRLYIYQWSGTNCQTHFDAGLTRKNGDARPTLATVRTKLRDSSILKP